MTACHPDPIGPCVFADIEDVTQRSVWLLHTALQMLQLLIQQTDKQYQIYLSIKEANKGKFLPCLNYRLDIIYLLASI